MYLCNINELYIPEEVYPICISWPIESISFVMDLPIGHGYHQQKPNLGSLLNVVIVKRKICLIKH